MNTNIHVDFNNDINAETKITALGTICNFFI